MTEYDQKDIVRYLNHTTSSSIAGSSSAIAELRKRVSFFKQRNTNCRLRRCLSSLPLVQLSPLFHSMASLASRSLKALRTASRAAPRVASQRASAASYSLLTRPTVACASRGTMTPNVIRKHFNDFVTLF
jgi:hypothetical protein